jgi:large subunit ribosomal protein L25
MAEKVTLNTQPRPQAGSRAAARVRKQGRVPAVIYGHKEAVETVSVDQEELETALRHHVRNLEVKTDGRMQVVLIQDVQRDYLGKEILHIDFRRVSADERVRVVVDIELRGVAKGTNSGGVLQQPLHSLHVECLATAVPESIRVKIDELEIGHALYVKDVKLPDGVKVLDDPEAIVVQVTQPVKIEEVAPAVPAEGAAAAAEPEVITARKPKDGEEEAPAGGKEKEK